MRAVPLLAVVLLVLAGGGGTAPCALAGGPPDSAAAVPAARVNGVAIERPAVLELVKGLARAEPAPPDSARIADLTDSAVDSLIDLELLYQEAVRRKVVVTAEEVDREVARVRGHFPSEAEFAAALESRGMTQVEMRLDTRRTLMADRLLRQTVWRDVRVDSTEVEQFYQENRAQLGRPLSELRDSIAKMLLDDKRSALRTRLLEGLRGKASIRRFPPFGPARAGASPGPPRASEE
jgi:hypothetical protein